MNAEISWEELCAIYEDFLLNKKDKYEEIRDDFFDTYLRNMNKDKPEEEKIKIHSIRTRVKDPEHLMEKIVRKKADNDSKYRELNKTNYEKVVMDLIGIRCLILFKTDWLSFHHYIMSQFENKAEYYIKDCLRDFDEDDSHYYFAEEPKVHLRNGDAREIYKGVLSDDCIVEGRIYRSVHYILKYKGVYLEMQVRTLFEEGWGEIDHVIAYPYYKDDPVFKEYTELMNRLSGLADEMGGFFNRLKELEIENLTFRRKSGEKIVKENDETQPVECVRKEKQGSSVDTKQQTDTPGRCLDIVLDE